MLPLVPALLASLAAPQATPPQHVTSETWTGSELARAAGVPVAGGRFVVPAGRIVSVELPSPYRFRSAGLWWRGQLGEAWLAVVDPAGHEGPLHPVAEAHDLSPEVVGRDRPAGDRLVSGLFHQYDSAGTAVRLSFVGPVDLEELVTVWIAPYDRPPGRRFEPADPSADGSYPKPPVYSRSFWGAIAPTCTYSYCNTTHMGVHHSASTSDFTASTLSQCAGNVKGIQTFHMFTNGWCDIGYNYLVCKHGDVFEGRGGGDNVKGAHDGKNCGSMGVCMLGYFHPSPNQQPTAAMLDSLGDLGAWKFGQQNINPFGTSFYAGLGASMTTVYGHRDVSATACPGDHVYSKLGQVKTDISNKLNGSPPPPPPPPGSGTLKGVLYNSAIGTSARIQGGTVSLADGTFKISDGSGYYEFPLPAGNYAIAATAPGFNATSSSETVGSGDVWESMGMSPNGGLPVHTVTPLSGTLFQATFQGDPGTPAYLGYSLAPNLPLGTLSSWGVLWPHLGTIQALALGNVPGGGTLSTNLQAPNTPGLHFHSQGLVIKGGVQRLTNGAGWLVQ